MAVGGGSELEFNLRLVDVRRARKEPGTLSSGVEIECDLRTTEHPEGRFQRADGTRYDICVMELMTDPGLRPPTLSRSSFTGERADSGPAVIRLGNVKGSSFRLRQISPGPPAFYR